MALLDDLGSYLASAGIGVLGTSLFLGSLPMDSPIAPEDEITAIVPIPGLPSIHSHQEALASYTQPAFQILTRSAPYGFATAMSRAEAAFVALDGLHNQVLGSTYLLWCLSLQSPFLLRVDDNNRFHLVFSVRCAVRAAA